LAPLEPRDLEDEALVGILEIALEVHDLLLETVPVVRNPFEDVAKVEFRFDLSSSSSIEEVEGQARDRFKGTIQSVILVEVEALRRVYLDALVLVLRNKLRRRKRSICRCLFDWDWLRRLRDWKGLRRLLDGDWWLMNLLSWNILRGFFWCFETCFLMSRLEIMLHFSWLSVSLLCHSLLSPPRDLIGSHKRGKSILKLFFLYRCLRSDTLCLRSRHCLLMMSWRESLFLFDGLLLLLLGLVSDHLMTLKLLVPE